MSRTGRGPCTCAGTAPGYPQHESGCGQPEIDEDEVPMPDEPCPYNMCGGGFDPSGHMDCLAEGRLWARDYESWAAL